MRVFTPENSFADRVNFVDENNVLVGVYTDQQCCEDFDWWVEDNEGLLHWSTFHDLNAELKGYVFDTKYGIQDIGGGIKLKLVREAYTDIYLSIQNIHNGYYSHKIEVTSPIQDSTWNTDYYV